MNFDNIPPKLKVLNQWAVYKSYLDRESGKYKKIIISPVTSKFAKCNDPTTWADYDTAKQYCLIYNYLGLTFALTQDITFIDIDNAIDPVSGIITSPEAIQLLKQCPKTYTEKSVSGKGIHILLGCNLPKDALKRNDSKGLEMYDTNRFICMTGNLLEATSSVTIIDYSTQIANLNYTFIGRRPPPITTTKHTPTLTDNQLIQSINNSKQGAKFSMLYSGIFTTYPSQSNADFALVSMLAWWTQDPSQIDRIFQSSGLYRPKWHKQISGSTYGEITIQNALSLQHTSYTPNSSSTEMA